MFTGDDDLLNLIQIEANTLVDTILEESVSIVNNSSSSIQVQEPQQLSREVSFEENENEPHLQPPSQLTLINNNNSIINNNNNNLSDHASNQISDEISENFAIKSDYDLIVKSPTIESMSGKSFEDDEINNFATTPQSCTVVHDVSLDVDNITTAATNITPSTSVPSHELDDNDNGIENVHIEAQKLVDNVLDESLDIVNNKQEHEVKFSGVTFAMSSDHGSEDECSENDAIVRNIDEHKLHRVERKFEHLSSEVREDDAATVDDLVNKEDVSMLQTDFSKISWDESLSAATGEELGSSSTPDKDLQEVLNIPGDTYRQLHNK